MVLKQISYIHYLVWFRNKDIWALINSGSKVNAITPTYIAKLGLKIHHIDVATQKNDSSILETFKIVLENFQMEDKQGQAWYFQETFLLAHTNVKIILEMPFFTFSNVNI